MVLSIDFPDCEIASFFVTLRYMTNRLTSPTDTSPVATGKRSKNRVHNVLSKCRYIVAINIPNLIPPFDLH